MQAERVLPEMRPSILLDYHAGKPSAIDAINGMAVGLGRQPGMPAPCNEVLTTVLRQRGIRIRFAEIVKPIT